MSHKTYLRRGAIEVRNRLLTHDHHTTQGGWNGNEERGTRVNVWLGPRSIGGRASLTVSHEGFVVRE